MKIEVNNGKLTENKKFSDVETACRFIGIEKEVFEKIINTRSKFQYGNFSVIVELTT